MTVLEAALAWRAARRVLIHASDLSLTKLASRARDDFEKAEDALMAALRDHDAGLLAEAEPEYRLTPEFGASISVAEWRKLNRLP